MSKLDQMRMGARRLIAEDSDIGTIIRAVEIDNGRDEMIPTDDFDTHKVICRVSVQSSGIWRGEQWEGGLKKEKGPYVLARYNDDLEEGDILDWRNRRYVVGVVTRPEISGGFICTQAPLTETA